MGNMVYNVNDTATQVLAAKQVKENIFVDLVHKNGYGVTEQTETNVSTLRMLKVKPTTAAAREIGASTNGAFFNGDNAEVPQVSEYDLNLLYVYDRVYDILFDGRIDLSESMVVNVTARSSAYVVGDRSTGYVRTYDGNSG